MTSTVHANSCAVVCLALDTAGPRTVDAAPDPVVEVIGIELHRHPDDSGVLPPLAFIESVTAAGPTESTKPHGEELNS
ncbi:hypothetical protein ACQPZ2_30120 [Nocardia pseudovaccinii]|uniref:hypothetical protein n=1 Tax=Nocardia pseudovaccinii TaxID=189540 RepID=UPI003D8DFAFE